MELTCQKGYETDINDMPTGHLPVLTASIQQWQSTLAQAPSATAECVLVQVRLARQPEAEAAPGTVHSQEHH